MSIVPIRDNIIIKRTSGGNTTPGGLIIAGKERSDTGVVIAVGPGKVSDNGVLIPTVVKEGDTVLFNEFAGQPFKLDGQEYLSIPEGIIIGTLNEH